ncbi:phosphoribosylglycinamide formyltransferase [Clostridium sp. MD294]|uniref:phosphoribosylglycinamide formyltransferase n=1 Tax=Clostridium sp. MD294 TaxID=97138 RepID=UPI0002CBF333|nr:phosphoribosylglycinamide formyltransferase [Clostridium sp. MD294]NDO45680.1 phosphoribosylglycinamide formyltransferase [Clostridium sp. MD294]USF30667.1 Phosphoribosylglycinamide formyltransferase [Clostridium sp. MD294]
MLKVGVLVSGGGTNFQSIVDAIKSKKLTDTEIVTVVSSNPNAYALERAKKYDINAICIRKKDFETDILYQKALIQHMKAKEVELIVMAGFMVVIGSLFIKEFEDKIINIHPSLIPSFCGNGYYGLKVHEAALKKGVKITGATVHFVTEETDAGPIIIQKPVVVLEDDTPEQLQKRVMEEAEWEILPSAIQLFAHNRLKIVENHVKIL